MVQEYTMVNDLSMFLMIFLLLSLLLKIKGVCFGYAALPNDFFYMFLSRRKAELMREQ